MADTQPPVVVGVLSLIIGKGLQIGSSCLDLALVMIFQNYLTGFGDTLNTKRIYLPQME